MICIINGKSFQQSIVVILIIPAPIKQTIPLSLQPVLFFIGLP